MLEWLTVGGAKVKEVAPLARILRTRDLPRRRVDNRKVAIADHPALCDLAGVQLVAHHRLDRIAPQANTLPAT
jgi:hypothetical protein